MRVALIVVALAFIGSPSHASPSCMTIAEARAAFPGKHLWWHGPNKCWDATPGRRQLAKSIKARESAREEPQPQEPQKSLHDKPAERAAAEDKKPLNWSHEHRWREALSRMRPEDDAAMRSSAGSAASARASAAVSDAAPDSRPNWRDRWVEVVPRGPPVVGQSEPAERAPAATMAAAAPNVDAIVTPMRVMLALLAFVLMLGIVELVSRGTPGSWLKPHHWPGSDRARYALLRFSIMLRKSVARLR